MISNELKWKHFGAGEETTYEKVIRNAIAANVLEELKDIDVLNWKAKYVEPDVLDGTQWSIEIIRNERNIKKYGSNLYPDGWKRFCEMIRHTSGRKFE